MRRRPSWRWRHEARIATSSCRRRRGLWGPEGGARPAPRTRRGHPGRPPELHALPAARVPGGDRRALARRDRHASSSDPEKAAERSRRAGGGHRLRPRTARGASRPPAQRRRAGYATLIVAGGSHYSYFGHEEWRTHAPELKSLAGALDIRSRVLGAFEAAEVEPDPERRRGWLTFVVAGGGPTGVEMAGQIAEVAHDALRRDFRWVDTTRARVLLVEAADRVLAGFPEQLSRRASRSLEGLGVTPLARHTVVDVTADSVAIESRDGALERVGARTAIWAAGVTASGLAAKL